MRDARDSHLIALDKLREARRVIESLLPAGHASGSSRNRKSIDAALKFLSDTKQIAL